MTSPVVIVRKVEDDQPEAADVSPLQEAQRLEASLLPSSGRLLMDFPVRGMERSYLWHLEQRIHRNPRDLQSHVRRILLWRALRDGDAMYGAIVDLFLVLGYRGRPLRSRLLALVGAELSSDRMEILSGNMEHGLEPTDARISTEHSLLSRHVTGTTGVVVNTAESPARQRDLLAVARDALAHGDDAAAQSVLEGALDADPGAEEVSLELLALYKRKHLYADFKRTYTVVLGRQVARADLWRAMAVRFEKEHRGTDEQL